MTVLGDLAQATGPASPASWEATLAHLGRPDERAARPSSRWATGCPGAFLSLANRLLPIAAPGSRAVAFGARRRRSARPAPRSRPTSSSTRSPSTPSRSPRSSATVAVIAADARVDELRARDRGRAASCSPSRARSTPDRPLVVLPGPLAKGLEFDAVIVVEPAEIAADGTARRPPAVRRAHPAVQHLAIAHREPLPEVLARRVGCAAMPDSAPVHITTRSGNVRVEAVASATELAVDGGTIEVHDDGSIHVHAGAVGEHDRSCGARPAPTSPSAPCRARSSWSARSARCGSRPVSGKIRVDEAARDRRAYEVGQDRHRHVRGRVPGHDQERHGARRQRGPRDGRRRSRALVLLDEVDGAEVKTVSGKVLLGSHAAPTGSSVHTVSGKVEIRVPGATMPGDAAASRSAARSQCELRAGRRRRDRGHERERRDPGVERLMRRSRRDRLHRHRRLHRAHRQARRRRRAGAARTPGADGARARCPTRARVVKELGDGLLLWFDDPRDAIDTCLRLQHEFDAVNDASERRPGASAVGAHRHALGLPAPARRRHRRPRRQPRGPHRRSRRRRARCCARRRPRTPSARARRRLRAARPGVRPRASPNPVPIVPGRRFRRGVARCCATGTSSR